MSLPKLIQAPNTVAHPKRALILAGGGVRLAYQAGVLQALQEKGLQFQHVDGTSGGIFNTAMLASGLEPEEMCVRWRKLKINHFMSMRPAKKYLRLASMTAFGDADGIRKKVFPALGIDLPTIRANHDVCATFNVCNFSQKSIEAIPNSEVTEDHLIAGVSLPIFMPAIQIENDWYSDAVWIKDANLMEAVRRGAEEIWLVWAIGNTQTYLPGFFNQYVHMIEMSANGGLLEEYHQIKALNERILSGDSPYGQKSPIRLHVIKPEYPLPLDPDLFLNKIDASSLINMGYEDTLSYWKSKTDKGIDFEKCSTCMKAPGKQFSFRHKYEGSLAFQDKACMMRFSPSFTVREIDGHYTIRMVASLWISALGREISTKENKASMIKKDKASYLEMESTFVHEGKNYQLKALIRLHAISSWLLGLEFKKVKIQLYDERQNLLSEGFLWQSAGHRIQQLLNHKMTINGQGGIRWKEKYQLLKKLYA